MHSSQLSSLMGYYRMKCNGVGGVFMDCGQVSGNFIFILPGWRNKLDNFDGTQLYYLEKIHFIKTLVIFVVFEMHT